jgi:hypothetical protein
MRHLANPEGVRQLVKPEGMRQLANPEGMRHLANPVGMRQLAKLVRKWEYNNKMYFQERVRKGIMDCIDLAQEKE